MGLTFVKGLGAVFVVVALGLFVSSIISPTDQPSDDPLVRALMDRSGTTHRLTQELQALLPSPEIDRLIEQLDGRAARVDALGRKWQDAKIIALLDPEAGSGLEALSQAIATIRHPEFVDKQTRARIDAATTVGLLPSPERTTALLAVLRERREPTAVREAVVAALSSSTDPAVVAALDEHWYADSNRFALAAKPVALRGASLEMRLKRVAAFAKSNTAESVTGLLTALKDSDAKVRANAAWALKGRSGDGVQNALIHLVNPNEDYTVVYKTLAAIEGCPSEAYLMALLDTFQNAKQHQSLVLDALIECDDARVVQPMVDSLDQRQSALGLRAANALVMLVHEKRFVAITPLQVALQRNDIAAADRVEIQRALEKLLTSFRKL